MTKRPYSHRNARTAASACVLAAVVLMGTGCVRGEEGLRRPAQTPPPARAAFGVPLAMAPGDAPTMFEDGLTVSLVRIDDSRCPADVVCAWEGELSPLFDLSGGSVENVAQVRLGTVTSGSAVVAEYTVDLMTATPQTVEIVVSLTGQSAADAVRLSGNETIVVNEPSRDALVGSPLTVNGMARGSWYFEGDFPLRLLDAAGDEIAKGYASAQAEWMTEDLVPFVGVLTFDAPGPGSRGTLVLDKDNPSGLPEHDASISVPVIFE